MDQARMKRSLPGDPSPEEILARALRVDHAGEYGAKRIYQGQLAIRPDETIRHMAAQEEHHLAYFSDQIVKRQVRPTALHPFWHVAGFALGAATALMGRKAAMACTAAVEEVIDNHYREQIETLKEAEPDLAAQIEIFRREEVGHRDTALEQGAEKTPGYFFLSNAIKLGCRLAIKTAERI
jgi:ubiquinone biosynthesis monooxygenase Coq7